MGHTHSRCSTWGHTHSRWSASEEGGSWGHRFPLGQPFTELQPLEEAGRTSLSLGRTSLSSLLCRG